MYDLFMQKLGSAQQVRVENIKGYLKSPNETAKSLLVCKTVLAKAFVSLEVLGNKRPR